MMAWDGVDRPTGNRCVTLEFLNELYDEIAMQKNVIERLRKLAGLTPLELERVIESARS